MAERRWDSTHIIDSAALSVPAVRMAIVYGGWGIDEDNGEEEPWSGFTPVLAIQATVRRNYSRRHDPNRDAVGATTRDLEENGWRGTDSLVHHDFLVMDPTGNDYGFCEASAAFDMQNVCHEPIACPWPPEEDAERLAPLMAKMVADAKAAGLARIAREKRPIPVGVKGG